MNNQITFLDKTFHYPKSKELYNFFIEFYAYIRSGNDYVVACSNIAKRTENKIMKTTLNYISRSLDDGNTLTEAFSEHKVFPRYIIAALRAGEESGTVDNVIKEISLSLKHEMQITKKVSNAFLPIKMASIAFIFSFVVLSNMIVPRYEKLYMQKKIALPLITKIIFGIVNFINTYWLLLLIVIVIAVFFSRWFIRENPVFVDELRIKIPYYKRVYYVLVQYRLSSIIIILHDAGLSTIDTLHHTAEVLGSKMYANICAETVRNIVNGTDFATALRNSDKTNRIDPMIKNFIQTGETTGSISEILSAARDFFKDTIDDVLIEFSNRVNFLCLLPIAIGIVSIYIAVFAPQFALFQALRMRG